MIFDVDKGLNIHLIFMNLSPMSEEFGVTKPRLRSIISANEEVGMAIRNRQIALPERNPLAVARSRTNKDPTPN